MNDALNIYVLCVVVLFLKMFLVSCYQGYHRLRFVAFTNPDGTSGNGRIWRFSATGGLANGPCP